MVDAAPNRDRALVEIGAAGARREWSFGEVADVCARLAGTFAARGVGRGDVVMTLIGSRPQWVFAMVACFRIGAVALPCNEQLRAKDLRMRIDAATPRLIVADARNATELNAALSTSGDAEPPEVILIPDPSLLDFDPVAAVQLAPTDPCLITFTSGTTGEAKGSSTGSGTSPARRCRPATGSERGAVTWSGARPPAVGRSRPATRSSRRGCGARRRCCTTLASIRGSGSSCSRPSASTCSAWRRPSTA